MSSDVRASDVAKYMNETVSTLCEERSVAADSQDRTGEAGRVLKSPWLLRTLSVLHSASKGNVPHPGGGRVGMNTS